jgi:hypothetical protein
VPAIELADLRAEMEAERAWRESELRLLRNLVASMPDEDSRSIGRKALVVMLYAHFEGATKALLSMYVSRLNGLGLLVSEVIAAIGTGSAGSSPPNSRTTRHSIGLRVSESLSRSRGSSRPAACAWTPTTSSIRSPT